MEFFMTTFRHTVLTFAMAARLARRKSITPSKKADAKKDGKK